MAEQFKETEVSGGSLVNRARWLEDTDFSGRIVVAENRIEGQQNKVARVVTALDAITKASDAAQAADLRDQAMITIARQFQNESDPLKLVGTINQELRSHGRYQSDMQVSWSGGSVDFATYSPQNARGGFDGWNRRSVQVYDKEEGQPIVNAAEKLESQLQSARTIASEAVKPFTTDDPAVREARINQLKLQIAKHFSGNQTPLDLLGAVNQRFKETGQGLQLTITGLSGDSYQVHVNVKFQGNSDYTRVPEATVNCSLPEQKRPPARAPRIEGVPQLKG